MKKWIIGLLLIGLISSGAAFLVGCSDDDDDNVGPSNYANENWDTADLERGGLLYDKWWKINSGTEPTEDFDPIWSTQDINTRSGGDTWRCKECHGWDYKGINGAYSSGSHQTGFAGIWGARSNDKTVIFDAIKAESADHNLSQVLSDVDILDLTKFVVDGLIDMSTIIDYTTKASLGDATAGQALYDTNCSSCHGADGQYGDVNDPEYLSDLAWDNPWETLHKIRFGHPGTNMSSMVEEGLTIAEQSNILAAVQALEPPHFAEENWGDADLAMGGLLYDKWWKVNGGTEPAENFDPIWSSQTSNTRSGGDTWRCKECHGWDYQGALGAYSSGSSHYTGFTGVWPSRSDDKTEIFDAIKGAGMEHDLSGNLSDENVLDLTKFVVDGLILMSDFINYDTKASLGNVANGQTLYEDNCSSCHGADGKNINFGDETDPEYVGDLARGNPWEILHKIRYGQPDTAMPGMVDEGLTAEEQSDILAYSQSLAE